MARPARFGLLANTCALASLLMGFGQAGVTFVLAYLGLAEGVVEGSVPDVQGVLMWGLAAAAVLGIGLETAPSPSAP